MLTYSIYHYFVFSVPEIILITLLSLQLSGYMKKYSSLDKIKKIEYLIVPAFICSTVFLFIRNSSLHFYIQLPIGFVAIAIAVMWTHYWIDREFNSTKLLVISFISQTMSYTIQYFIVIFTISVLGLSIVNMNKIQFTIMIYVVFAIFAMITLVFYKKNINLDKWRGW